MRRAICMCAAAGAALAVGIGEASASASQSGLYGGRAQTARNREAAFQDAARLLASVNVPHDAGTGRAVPRSSLHALQAADNRADAGRRWTVPGTLSSVIGYVRRHRPRGSSFAGSGSGSGPGPLTTSRSVSFAWPPVGESLMDRQLQVTVSPAGDGRVRLLAQAESIWLTARPSSERFPTSTRRIELRLTAPHHASLVRRETNAATVSRIVALFNAVPVTQPVFYGCPVQMDMQTFVYTLLGASGDTLARITYRAPRGSSPGPCDPMSVTIGGRTRHALLGGPQVVTVQRVFQIPTAS